MKLSFQLTMPNNNSWNGKWTGEGKKYYFTHSVRSKADKESVIIMLDGKDHKNFYYNFGDGWGANVRMEIIDDAECRRRTKQSAGFCGYTWMVWSILENGFITPKNKNHEAEV